MQICVLLKPMDSILTAHIKHLCTIKVHDKVIGGAYVQTH